MQIVAYRYAISGLARLAVGRHAQRASHARPEIPDGTTSDACWLWQHLPSPRHTTGSRCSHQRLRRLHQSP